jgi:hypothetical protein
MTIDVRHVAAIGAVQAFQGHWALPVALNGTWDWLGFQSLEAANQARADLRDACCEGVRR